MLLLGTIAAALTLAGAGGAPDYATELRPILERHCFSCHGPERQKAGLRLDFHAGILNGGDGGAIVAMGKPEESRLLDAVRGDDPDFVMPPKGDRLTDAETAVLREWILAGAPGPDEPETPTQIASDHWAFQPVVAHTPPPVKDTAWVRNRIDHFVLARLEGAGVTPSPEADPETLLRRLYLDLTGLPPSLEETEDFLADESPYAYERLVNRLLASPHYGERWGRHWLDLARYADSDGYEKDTPRPWAWRYRDWVIDALNRDLPYDQFVIEQLAGDLLPNATTAQRVATGFHRNTLTNKEGGVDPEQFRVEQVVDRTNTTGAVFMGLTVACAQCHTHKYDPITQREYFELYSFFDSGLEKDIPAPLDGEEERYAAEKARHDAALKNVNEEIAAHRETLRPALDAWAAAQTVTEIAWRGVRTLSARAASGAPLDLLSDGSILARGDAPDKDTYTVEIETDTDTLSALRIEALIDGSLPRTGPGRSGNGNFVLTKLDLHRRDRAAAEIDLTNHALGAVATSPDHLDADGGAMGDGAAIDGNPETFWDEVDDQGEYHFRLDFPEARTFSALSLQGYEHRRFAPKDFKIVCDGETVQDVQDASYRHNLFVTGFEPVTCTSLELVITGYYGGSPAIRELGLYQADVDPLEEALSPPMRVALDTAIADFDQKGFDAAGVFDDDAKTGWAIGADKETNQHRSARFVAGRPIDKANRYRFTLSIEQAYGGGHVLGRFRIAATDHARAGVVLPDAVRTALLTPATERSAAQNELLLDYYARGDARMRELAAKREGVLAAAPKPVNTMAQAIVENPDAPQTHIHARGDFLRPTQPVDHGTPAVLPALNPRGPNADRLDLARWIVRHDNPLTPRVAANRIWEKLFGEGLVRTPEDFGTRSEAPTHPLLLDWLANEYQARGWSTKDFIRLIVTSATYRQASHTRPELVDQDPQNRLIARQDRFRVEAEIIRDLALAASGLLAPKVGGPSIRPPLPEGFANLGYANSIKYPESNGDDKYRRGLYIQFQRTIAYPMLMNFDCPDSNTANLRRSRSNTPLQALNLMNDPVFIECAQGLAKRMQTECGGDDRARVAWAFKLCFARTPTEAETDALVALLDAQRETFRDAEAFAETLAAGHRPKDAAAADAAAHVVLARTLINLDEFITRE